MYKVLGIAVIIFAGSWAAAQTAVKLSEKFEKKLEAADTAYQQAVAKADNTRFYAVQKATADRVKVLKQAMTDATKSGDLDAANEIKSRITAAEAAGAVRAKPKNTVKFAGHEYALIEDKATWHVAKKICEEMGGHLVTIDSAGEEQFILELGTKSGLNAWVGASDEEVESDWRWIDGKPVKLINSTMDNGSDAEHHLHFSIEPRRFNDYYGSARFAFFIEFE